MSAGPNIDREAEAAAREALEAGELLEEWAARVIAGWWHGGQWSPLYSFSSSGHLDRPAVERELDGCVPEPGDREAAESLEALRRYVAAEQRAPAAWCEACERVH